MSNNDYDIQSSRAITTRGFQTDPIFMDQSGDRADLAKMEKRAILDAVAVQVMQRKGLLAQRLGDELIRQARVLFLEELEESDAFLKRAEKLSSHHARKRFVVFVEHLWDQYEAFLLYTAADSSNQMRQIAARSPYPEPEVQRSWLRRLFRGD